MSRTPGRDASGFTLLEMLVSLVLLALLSTVLLEGVRFATRTLERQLAGFERAGALPPAYGFLRTSLAGARPIVPVNGETDAVAFDGRSDSIAFVSAAPRGAVRGGLYLFTVDVASDRLRARWRLFNGLLPGAEEDAGEAMLLDRVGRIDIAYFGGRPGDADVAWRDQWRGVPYLPLAVRFGIELENGGTAPALVVAPRLQPLRTIPVATGAVETPR